MERAGRFSPFDYRIKTHLVANSLWRITSVKQANLKSRNRLNYYCQLFALFWVIPVRAPQSLNQVQGGQTPICGPFPIAPAGRAIVQPKRIFIPDFAHFPQQPSWRHELRPVPEPKPFPASSPSLLKSSHSIILFISLTPSRK
jgi:hypothetical protein